jgi:hypothetical protein
MGAGAVPCARLAAFAFHREAVKVRRGGGSEWRAGGDSGGLGRLRSACPTDPACGRWENAAAESKQVSGLMILSSEILTIFSRRAASAVRAFSSSS